MTRIRDLLISFRTRRAQRFNNCDIVSFESFRNENISDFPKVKESSLTESNKKSPTSNKGRDYVKFSSQSTKSDCSRPTLATSLLLIVLMAVFLILPIIYLLHCFGIIQISKQEFQHSHFALKAQDHYTPSTIVHDSLRLGKLYKKFGRNVLPPPPQPDPSECKVVKDINKFDCYPEDGATEEKCNARGCCWSTTKSKRFHSNKNISVPLNMPYCYYPSNFPTYKYVNASETAFGLVIFLKRNYKSAYPNDAETLKMTVKYETQDRLHIKITNPTQNRFESPYPEVPIVDKADENLNYIFVMDERNTGFKVLRKSDNTVIFDTTGLRNLIFADQFLQISSKLPSKYIYGLGEHRTNLLLDTNWQQFTMFNRDGAPTENANLYGSHPFYLVMEDSSGNSHGVFLLNSNAMDVILQPKPAITFRPIGGILDFYFFLGPTPSEVISQYTDLIGRPFLPAYWALGFHLCRYGYKSVNDTRDIMQRNIDAGILIDTQWNDLDYMNNSNDFTFDHKNFKTLPQFVKELHNKGMHYIPLVDPGISASETPGTYPPYDKGIEMDILVKNSSGLPFVGKVWNRASTVWPDFTHPHTVDYWTLMLRSMHDSFAFDGAWIDMNEPANFLSGSFTGCPESSLETPPYLPKVVGGQLNYKTFCMTAQHYAGVHYNVHNLYGITEAIVTSFAMAEIRGKRPMVISRSTFPGHGRYAGHWSGDVYSEWHDMRYSIPQLLSFSMFGIPLMGADICGFNGNTTVALCNRWSQLGAFYPFSRNHNTDDGIPQDPVGMGQPVIDSAKKALEVRYSLLPYLYTLFWAANVQGDTVARPLFFEFPNDRLTYDIDYMFLWGSSVLIVPVLEEDKVSVNIYLPTGIWYDYYTKKAIPSVGQNVTLPAPIDQIPVLIRGGSIIPQAKPNRTTVYSRQSKLELFCAPDKNGYASGMLFWDDGDSLNTVSEKRYSLVQFDLVPNKLQSYPLWWHVEYPPNLGVIAILGIETPVKVVMINNVSQEFKYDTINKYLIVEKLNLNFSETFELTWK